MQVMTPVPMCSEGPCRVTGPEVWTVLTERQLEAYTDVLIWGLKTARKERYKKNDVILIQYELPALGLAEKIYARILDMGMHPVQRMVSTFRMEHAFYAKSNAAQLGFVAAGEKELSENINGRIFLRAPESLTHLQDVDSTKIGKFLTSRKYLRDIFDAREEQGRYSWTLCLFPTKELAQQAKATLPEYTDQVIRACYLDKDDPVAEWEAIYQSVTRIKKWLNGMKVDHYRVESRSFDLRVTPGEQRKWVGISGHNIPSFEIFLSPDWRGVDGTYYANLPSYRTGNYVEGVRITLKKGKAVKVEAETNEEFVKKQLKMDRGASSVGEFSLTDKRFSRIDRFMADTLYDENFGGDHGNCHVALGSSYSATFSGDPRTLTKEIKEQLGFNYSALHWDLVNTEEKTVTAYLTNGKKVVIYENGMFLE